MNNDWTDVMKNANNHAPVVYYLTSRQYPNVVKIGTTTNLARRLSEHRRRWPCANVLYLSCEPGGPSLESQRHRQFDQYRLMGEWFFRSQELNDWIVQTYLDHGEVA